MSVTYLDDEGRLLMWPVPTWAWLCHNCGRGSAASTPGEAKRAALSHRCGVPEEPTDEEETDG